MVLVRECWCAQGEYVDIWALGVLLYFMLVGRTPFRGDTVSELKKLILEGVYTTPDTVSLSARTLITAILNLVPAARLSLNDITVGTRTLRTHTAHMHCTEPRVDESGASASQIAQSPLVKNTRRTRLGSQ
jgi:serine/threonine protein kinase